MSTCGECPDTFQGPMSGVELHRPKFWLRLDHRNPPPGGWSFDYNGNFYGAETPDQAIDKMASVTGNGLSAYEALNEVYCARAGAKCQRAKTLPQSPANLAMGTTGPILWGMLYLSLHHGTTGEVLDEVLLFLDPADSPKTGCESCYRHAMDFKASNPFPYDQSTELQARWIWALHNSVNRKLNKKEMTFEQAQTLWKF